MKRWLPLLLLTLSCNREAPAPAPAAAIVAGDAARGRELIARFACNVCHVVPGTEGPQGSLAPSLAGLARRPFISQGTVQNTPDNLRRFITSPTSMNPSSAMPPVLGMTDADAQDLTAFLVTLR